MHVLRVRQAAAGPAFYNPFGTSGYTRRVTEAAAINMLAEPSQLPAAAVPYRPANDRSTDLQMLQITSQ
jgi:hypothetical protein